MPPDYRPLLDEAERLSLQELRALQLQRLQWSVGHAYARCAPYRAKCQAKGVAPDRLQSLADLAEFPFTTKEDLRQAYPFGFFAAPLEQLARVHASSGTTGRATVVGYTAQDIQTWAKLVARSIRAAGGRPGMKVHIAFGYGLFTGGLGAHYGAEELGCLVIPMSGGHTEKQVQLLQDFQPDIIMATPSYMLAILDEYRRQGLDPAKSSLKLGIFGAEPWSEPMRREIETAFNIDAVDIYGLSEVMGPGVANECVETKDGLTVWEDHFYPEIIDPRTGAPAQEQARGELVLTSLTKEAMPVIRYRTRDLTRLLPPSARPMRRLERIGARSDDMLIIRGVNLFPSQIEEMILGIAALAPHYLLEVSRPDRLDALLCRVEARPGASGADRSAAAAHLAALVKNHIGVSMAVAIEEPNSLTRSAGKAVRVLDLRTGDA